MPNPEQPNPPYRGTFSSSIFSEMLYSILPILFARLAEKFSREESTEDRIGLIFTGFVIGWVIAYANRPKEETQGPITLQRQTERSDLVLATPEEGIAFILSGYTVWGYLASLGIDEISPLTAMAAGAMVGLAVSIFIHLNEKAMELEPREDQRPRR